MKKIFLVPFLWLAFSVIAQAQSNTVSGSISLPPGMVAGLGGVTFEVRTFPIQIIDGPNGLLFSSDEVTITASSNSASFSFPVLDTDTVENNRIQFECVSNCGGSFTTAGLWNEIEGVVGAFFSATEYPNNSRSGSGYCHRAR